MTSFEKIAKMRVFKELGLNEKMSLYERGEVVDNDFIKLLYQEMIDTGLCWGEQTEQHYARYAARYINMGWCEPSSKFPMPEEAKDNPAYLLEALQIGFDVWNRPPTHDDWGRPLRWKEVRRDKIQQFRKNIAELKTQGVDLEEGCCK